MGAILAGALDEEADLLGYVPFRQFNHRYLDVEAVGLPAACTLEMDVLMSMACCGTSLGTKRVFQDSAVVEHLVNKAAVGKGLQRPIHCDPVKIVRNFTLNVAVGERIILLQKKVQNFLAGGG